MPKANVSAVPMRLGQQGRVVLPAEVRKVLGVQPGDMIVAWIEHGRVVLRSRDEVERELWAMFDGIPESLVDELIEERRAEARREDQTE